MSVFQLVVDVMLKPEILDPQGQAVANALPSLGFAAPTNLRIEDLGLEHDVDDDLVHGHGLSLPSDPRCATYA